MLLWLLVGGGFMPSHKIVYNVLEVNLMILSICFDPILENKYYVDKLLLKEESLANKKIYNLSGNGLTTARILNNLNVDVFASGFLGGQEGDYIFNKLKDMDIYNDFISIKDNSKSRVVIMQEDELLTSITEESPRITRDELGSFYQLYAKILDRFSIISSQDNLPMGLPDDIYFDLISAANKKDIKFILEAKGEHLKNGLNANPFMVKLVKEDLEEISNLILDYETEIIKVGYSIVEQGVEVVAIDLGEKGSLVLTKEKGYRLEIDSSVGRIGQDKGYMVAGFAFGIYKKYDIDTVLKLSQASRLVYAIEDDLDRIDMSDIKSFMTKIDIYPINY